MMAEPESTCTTSPLFVAHCPVCGDVSTVKTPLFSEAAHVAQLLYLCPQGHGWIVKWAAV